MKGFDCNVKLSYELAKKFKSQGYDFVMRYVGRLRKSTKIDIDRNEIANIHRAGMSVGIVQHCPPKPGILPSKSLGEEYGKNAAKFSREAGYKAGCIIYLDLEDVNIKYKNRQQEIIDFCNEWYKEVLAAGYTPGVYVGFNTFLSGQELYYKLKFRHYWRSMSRVPDVYKRGYEMKQSPQIIANGIYIDPDEVTGDNLGNKPIFMNTERILVRTIMVYNNGEIEIIREDD